MHEFDPQTASQDASDHASLEAQYAAQAARDLIHGTSHHAFAARCSWTSDEPLN